MTDVNIRSLADFKRFLARPGATIETLRNDVMTRNGQTPETRPQAYGTRQVNTIPWFSGKGVAPCQPMQ
jgi:hypothetical protein